MYRGTACLLSRGILKVKGKKEEVRDKGEGARRQNVGDDLILGLPRAVRQAHNMSRLTPCAALWSHSSCCTGPSLSSFYSSPTSAAGSAASWRDGGGVQGVRAIYAYPEMQTLPSGLTLPALFKACSDAAPPQHVWKGK